MNSKCSAAVFVVALMVASALPLEQAVSAAPGSNLTLVAQNNDGPPPFTPPAGGDNPEPGINGRPGAFPGGPDGQNARQQWRRKRRWMQGGPGEGNPGQGGEPGMLPGGGGFQSGGPGMPGGMRRGGGGGFGGGMPGGMAPGGMGGGGFGAGMGKGNGRFHAGGHRLDLTPLNLTEQQKSRIQSLHEQARGQAKDIRKRLALKQLKLRDLLFSPDATDAQILAARRDMRELQDKMDELNVKDMLAIRGVLTPEQKAKLPIIMPGRRETAGGPGGMPGGPGGMPGGPGGMPGGPGGMPGPGGGMLPGGGSPMGFGSAQGQKIIEMRARAKMAGQSTPQD